MPVRSLYFFLSHEEKMNANAPKAFWSGSWLKHEWHSVNELPAAEDFTSFYIGRGYCNFLFAKVMRKILRKCIKEIAYNSTHVEAGIFNLRCWWFYFFWVKSPHNLPHINVTVWTKLYAKILVGSYFLEKWNSLCMLPYTIYPKILYKALGGYWFQQNVAARHIANQTTQFLFLEFWCQKVVTLAERSSQSPDFTTPDFVFMELI